MDGADLSLRLRQAPQHLQLGLTLTVLVQVLSVPVPSLPTELCSAAHWLMGARAVTSSVTVVTRMHFL